MNGQAEFDTAMNRFWRSQCALDAFVACGRSDSINRLVVENAHLAWCELLALRDDVRCYRPQDREQLDQVAESVQRLLKVLALCNNLPVMLLLKGDSVAWAKLADRFGGETEVVGQDKHRRDKAGDNSKIKLPRNPDVLELCRFLQCRRNNSRSRKENIREFCRQNGIRDTKVIAGLERQVKRFLHLV